MPELAEVESCRRAIERLAVGKRLANFRLANDAVVVKNCARTRRRLRRTLAGQNLERAKRHAKYLELEFSGGERMLLHLGMSGVIHVRAPQGEFSLHLKRGVTLKSRERFSKLELEFEDGTQLLFEDPRRFGRIELLEPETDLAAAKGLGRDLLDDPPSSKELRSALGASRRPIKACLLDQSAFAGVGNWLADDILLEAGLAPARLAASLDAKQWMRLRRAAIKVVRLAVEAGIDESRFPEHWLFHRRWNAVHSQDTRGNALRRDEVAGRSTVWVPALQS